MTESFVLTFQFEYDDSFVDEALYNIKDKIFAPIPRIKSKEVPICTFH